MLVYTVPLVAVTLLPAVLGMQGAAIYAAAAGLLGRRVFCRTPCGSGGRSAAMDAHSRRMFGFSILYLFALFGAMLADRLAAYVMVVL